MIVAGKIDTKQALLDAAAELISDSPGQDVSLRAICREVGVGLPTLYHFFGSKEGLIDAVIDYGFDRYLDVKKSQETSGDPIQDLRDGWDAHVAFGLVNSGLYALMYGQVAPGRRPTAQGRPTAILLTLTQSAADQGRLVVSPQQAADHILAANVGVTLHLITSDRPNTSLSVAMREATLAGITGESQQRSEWTDGPNDVAHSATDLLRILGHRNSPLAEPETVLLKKWLHTIAGAGCANGPLEVEVNGTQASG